MANPLQKAADIASANLPYVFTRLGTPTIVAAAPGTSPYPGTAPPIASVQEGNPVSSIYVENADDWTNPAYTPQLLRHEDAHRVINNWPQKLQNAMPPINKNDPYGYGGTSGLQAIGGDPLKLSQEQNGILQQQIQAMKQRKEPLPSIYRTYERKFQEVPLSVMQPTDPNGTTVNTLPRDPGLPPDYNPQTGTIDPSSSLYRIARRK